MRDFLKRGGSGLLLDPRDAKHGGVGPSPAPVREVLGPNGRSIRDEEAHRAFRREALSKSPRVVWEIPQVDGIEHRNVRLEDVMAIVKEDANHPVALEVARLMRAYRQNLAETFERLERTYNKGEMPQLALTRRPPRWPVEHVAQHCFAAMVQELIIDVTEEAELLHPDADVGRVVSVPGKVGGS
jgi:hypothetical protein